MYIKYRILCFVVIPFLSCCSTGKSITNNDSDGNINSTHIGLQFSRNGDCCFETKKCDGIWDQNKQSVFLSGLLIRKNSTGTVEQINISIEGIDLENTQYPHTVSTDFDEAAIVGWYNEQEVLKERLLCADSSNSCEFQGNVKRDKMKLVLTKFQNNVLEGRFEGRIFLKGTGNVKFVKTSEYKDIVGGSFCINLKDSSSEKNMIADKR